MNIFNRHKALYTTPIALLGVSIASTVYAHEHTELSGVEPIPEQKWGIAAVYRTASIPFDTGDGDQTVSTFVPMMFFEGERFYVDGTEAGAYLYDFEQSPFELNALMRLRFVDIPASAQNAIGGDAVDFGAQLRYKLNDNWNLDVELMSDYELHFHSNYSVTGEFEFGDWELQTNATIRYKSGEFNSEYFGFKEITGEQVSDGVDFNVGISTRYHVYSNLYLLGAASVTRLDDNAYNSSLIIDRNQAEFYLGFGFFNDKSKSPKQSLSNKRYLRVAHGWATPSNIGDIIKLNSEKDPYNNQMTSLFYGHPLTDEVFGLPLDIYFTPGIAHHWSSSVQSASTEYIAAIKAYYTFEWPVQWRFGVAEGLSYIDRITYIEQTEMDEKGYKASNLLNYLDFSFDVNVGGLIGNKDLENMWFGYSLHHRSAIFENASQFGRIKGGSNYNTIYLQYHF